VIIKFTYYCINMVHCDQITIQCNWPLIGLSSFDPPSLNSEVYSHASAAQIQWYTYIAGRRCGMKIRPTW